MTSRRLNLAALLLAATVSFALLFVPTVTSESGSARSGAPATREQEQLTLVESEGSGVLVALLVPIAITGLPLLVRNEGRYRNSLLAAVAAMSVGVVAALASIGTFYAPAVVILAVAMIFAERTESQPGSSA